MKAPLHASVLLVLLSLIGGVHFAMGWLGMDPSAMFPGQPTEGEGPIHLLGANGSRQLAIACLALVAAVDRRITLVAAAVSVRVVCEVFDIALYGWRLEQPASAMVAAALLGWEALVLVQLFKRSQPHA